MTNICTNCWTTCDIDDETEEEISLCCRSSVLRIDEEELEEIADQIEENCFTFDDAWDKFGNIAYYIAENMVFIPEYQGS